VDLFSLVDLFFYFAIIYLLFRVMDVSGLRDELRLLILGFVTRVVQEVVLLFASVGILSSSSELVLIMKTRVPAFVFAFIVLVALCMIVNKFKKI
jgi:hypothetical protein